MEYQGTFESSVSDVHGTMFMRVINNVVTLVLMYTGTYRHGVVITMQDSYQGDRLPNLLTMRELREGGGVTTMQLSRAPMKGGDEFQLGGSYTVDMPMDEGSFNLRRTP